MPHGSVSCVMVIVILCPGRILCDVSLHTAMLTSPPQSVEAFACDIHTFRLPVPFSFGFPA